MTSAKNVARARATRRVTSHPRYPHKNRPTARRADGSARHPDPPARRADPSARHPDPSARHPDPPARRPDPSARRPDPSARHPDPSPKSRRVMPTRRRVMPTRRRAGQGRPRGRMPLAVTRRLGGLCGRAEHEHNHITGMELDYAPPIPWYRLRRTRRWALAAVWTAAATLAAIRWGPEAMRRGAIARAEYQCRTHAYVDRPIVTGQFQRTPDGV